jgi:hypothetical protein
MKFPTLNAFLFKWVLCAVAPLLFYCQTPIQPPNTDSDYAEFESVWQWCEALSVYQDSSAFEGRIPADPFVFNQPRDIMLWIMDTLKGGLYTDYDWSATNGASAVFPSSAIAAGSIVATTTVFLDSLTHSTALLTIKTFDTDIVYSDFLACVAAASRFPNIVINMRYNRGGYIDQAVFIIESFVHRGTQYLQVRQRDYDTVAKKFVTLNWSTWTTEINPLPGFVTKHLAVLMNDTTASASEIVAAGLYEGRKDSSIKTLLIGTQSYGKGMGQSVVIRRTRKPLLITSLLLKGVSPRIGNYHRKGIAPDPVPQAIIDQADSLNLSNVLHHDWQRHIFYAVKMLDSTTPDGSINYPPEHYPNPAPASLSKVAPCYYKKIYQDNP